MADDNLPEKPAPEQGGGPLPQGYRQGVITAISVMLGFSLYLLRFWNLEATGDWTLISFGAAMPILLSITCLFVALWRSLQVADDDEKIYRVTLRWFFWGVVLSFVGVLAASVSYSGAVPN